MPRQREAAMQQTGQQPPMTREQDVRTAQTPPCANGPNGSARQDGVAPPPRPPPGDDSDDAESADGGFSGEQLEALRRECLERSALTCVPRLPSVIDKVRKTIKLEPPIFRVEESRVIMSNANTKAERTSLARSPSRSSHHSQRHPNHRHQEERHQAKVPSLILKRENRSRNRADSEPPSFRPKSPAEDYSERSEPPELSPSPPPVQSKLQPVKHEQRPRTDGAEDEPRQGDRNLTSKKEEALDRSKAGNCNYVLSDNYENLSGDESPVSRSLDASEVDHKAIELFLPLLDAMEKREEKDDESAAAVQSLCEGVDADDYDDLPEEGSLVIDDECVGCDASETNAVAAASNVSASEAGPATLSSSSSVDSPRDTVSPTAAAEPHAGSRSRCVDECSDTGARRLLLKDQRTKKSKMGLLRKAASADSAHLDDVATTPLQADPLPAKKRGRKPNPRPAGAQTPSRSTAPEPEDKGARGGARPGDDHGEGTASLSLRNGQRKRSRWKTAGSQEEEDAAGGGAGGANGGAGGSDSNNTVDYQFSSDEETPKGTGGSSDQPTPTPPPPPPAQIGASGKKQRKNSEDHRRSSGTVGGEPQHGDESRYKRLAQELPGFNWLEQKIMGHGGGNFSDAPPMPKHATMREPLTITAPTAHEKAEPKAAAPAPEVQRVYPPGTDILSRSMSEIQDDCCEEDAVDETPVIENVAVTPTDEVKVDDEGPQQDEMAQEEMQRQMLVAAMPHAYQSDPRLSQVITSTSVIRPHYSLEAGITAGNATLEMPMTTQSLTSAPMLACVPHTPDREAAQHESPESQAEGMSQGRVAVEDQSSDSDVLYLGVSRKGSSPNAEQRSGDSRALLLSAAAKPLESPMSVEASIARAEGPEKTQTGAPEPINLSDSARRGEGLVAPRHQLAFFQPHAFVMADHQRWLEERRYHEMMNTRGQLLQPRHLPPGQMPPGVPLRRVSGGPQMMPSNFEVQQQYRAALSDRSTAQQHSQPAHQGGGPPPRLTLPPHQAAPPHHPQLSHQSPQSHQPPQPHPAQILQPSPPSHQALQSHQPPTSQQAPPHHPLPHQAPPSHQAQLMRQVQMSHPAQQSHQPFYPMPRAHRAQPANQPPQPLPALTRDDSPRNVRPEFCQVQQHYKAMDQAYGVNLQAQQMGAYAGPQGLKKSPEPTTKNVPPQGFNPYAKDGKGDPSYKETTICRIERPGPPALQPVPANAKHPSTSPHAPQGDSAGQSSQTSNLKTEMEMLKGELKYLDALASQKEAEYEKVVCARAEKLRTLNQLEAKYKRSLEQPQTVSKDESRYPSSFEVAQGQSPGSQPDKASPSVEEPKAAPRQRSASSGGSTQQKQSPPSLPSPLSKTSPAHQPVPGLIPYPVPHPQQSRHPLPLPPQPNIPMNMPLIGAGMFNMRNMELQRDFAAMMAQSQNPAMMAGFGRPYYSLERGKHPALPPAEMQRPPAKRKYSPASASVPQPNGDVRVTPQQPSVAQAVHRQREPEKVTAPLSQEHAQWLQTLKAREMQGGPPAYPANAQSAFQTYNPFPQRRLLAEDVPLNPAMTNATWSNYAEGLHERYAFQMSKHGLYGAQPGWSSLEKQQHHQQQQQQQQQPQQQQPQQQQPQQQQQQQRSAEVQGITPPSREHPAKRLSREEFFTHHQVAKERHGMRPDDKLVVHAQSMARQVPTHDLAMPHQPPQVPPSGMQAKNNTCVLCGQYAQYMCSGCQNVWYCGPQCQRNNWVNHSHVCQGTKR